MLEDERRDRELNGEKDRCQSKCGRQEVPAHGTVAIPPASSSSGCHAVSLDVSVRPLLASMARRCHTQPERSNLDMFRSRVGDSSSVYVARFRPENAKPATAHFSKPLRPRHVALPAVRGSSSVYVAAIEPENSKPPLAVGLSNCQSWRRA
jgi:hypothetical protein